MLLEKAQPTGVKGQEHQSSKVPPSFTLSISTSAYLLVVALSIHYLLIFVSIITTSTSINNSTHLCTHPEMSAPPGSSHGYPAPGPGPGQQPITPINVGNSYPPPPPPSSGYYGLASAPNEHMPSPPPSSNGLAPGEVAVTFTPDGAPIVPVGVSGGKMFRCRGYGECDKVFTRSEHLARHVR